jgi:type I restriction enzyme S subunit
VKAINLGNEKLPKHWAIAKLPEFTNLTMGQSPASETYNLDGNGLPFFQGKAEFGSVYPTINKYCSEPNKIAEAGAILLSVRAPVGPTNLAQSRCCIGRGLAAIHPIGGVDSKFILLLFRSIELNLSGEGTGSTFKAITKAFVHNLTFAIPPLPEQYRIVAKIEELFSELDNGIVALKTAREQLKVYRQATLKHAFEGKLTAQWREKNATVPWRLEKLGNLLVLLTSGSRGWAQYYSDCGDTFIRAQNLKHDRLDLDEKAFVALPTKAEGRRTQVQVGDVLVTITGANVTKTGRVSADVGTAYVSQHVALCRPTEDIDSEFLYWFLVSEAAGRKQLSKFAYGAGKPGLNLDNIRSVEISLPSLEEQYEIVNKLRELLSIEENVSSIIETELRRVELIRQSVLKKAFSGQLVSQDPNDEPASELLDRMSAEKQKGEQMVRTSAHFLDSYLRETT